MARPFSLRAFTLEITHTPTRDAQVINRRDMASDFQSPRETAHIVLPIITIFVIFYVCGMLCIRGKQNKITRCVFGYVFGAIKKCPRENACIVCMYYIFRYYFDMTKEIINRERGGEEEERQRNIIKLCDGFISCRGIDLPSILSYDFIDFHATSQNAYVHHFRMYSTYVEPKRLALSLNCFINIQRNLNELKVNDKVAFTFLAKKKRTLYAAFVFVDTSIRAFCPALIISPLKMKYNRLRAITLKKTYFRAFSLLYPLPSYPL